MSKTRCANTVPTSVAHAPLRSGIFRVSTATRASSPTRPGSRAFANRPTEKAEKTSGTRGCGGSIAEWMTVVQASARATTERRFSAIATTTHSHSHGPERAADRLDAVAPPPEQADDRREHDEPQEHPQDPARRQPEEVVVLEVHPGHYRRLPGAPPFPARSRDRPSRAAGARRARGRAARTSSPTRRSSVISAARRSPRSASPAPCSQAPSRSSTSSPTGRRRSSRARRARAGTTKPPGSRRRRSGRRSGSALVLLVACEIVAVAAPRRPGRPRPVRRLRAHLLPDRGHRTCPPRSIALAGQGYLRGVSNLRRPLEIVVVGEPAQPRARGRLRLRLPLGDRGLGGRDGDRAGRDGRRLRRRAAAPARAVAAAEPGRR